MEHGPIYIGGPDRCGKTTMRAFLASHPNIAIPDVGSNMWTYFYGQYGSLAQPANFERCLDDLLHYKHVRFLQPDPDRIRREFWQGPPTYARLFALFLIHYAEQEGKPRWGAQTGLIERYADRLFAAYPGLKIIHMIRDPRDRYEASLALWPNGKGRVGSAAARWLYSVGLAHRHQQRYPGQYKIVRFESMVTQPEATIREVCAFLNEEFLPEMLTMSSAPKHRERLSRGAGDVAPTASPVSTDFIGLYRHNVPRQELAFMQRHAGQAMLAHGYALEPLHFSAGEWAHFWAVTWPLNLARLAAWRSWEAMQQNLPALFGRQFGQRMKVAPYTSPAAGPEVI